MPSYVLTTPPARRSTFEWHLRRWALALTAALLAVLGIVTPAYAEGVADISKALDTTQGAGFTAPNTFQSGALVRYRITLSCSSNTSDCGVGKFSDVLEPGLVPVDVVLPTTTLPLSKSISGQTVSVTIGTTAAPWPDSSTLELVVVARVTGTRVGTIPNTGTITTHS
jgi:hypothetical protein